MMKDPVCRMEVQPNEAAARADFEGRTYYFCSTHCQRTFQADPKEYAAPEYAGPKQPEPRGRCCG